MQDRTDACHLLRFYPIGRVQGRGYLMLQGRFYFVLKPPKQSASITLSSVGCFIDTDLGFPHLSTGNDKTQTIKLCQGLSGLGE